MTRTDVYNALLPLVARVGQTICNDAFLRYPYDTDDAVIQACPRCLGGLVATARTCTRCGGEGISETITLNEWVRGTFEDESLVDWVWRVLQGSQRRLILRLDKRSHAQVAGHLNEALALVGSDLRVVLV